MTAHANPTQPPRVRPRRLVRRRRAVLPGHGRGLGPSFAMGAGVLLASYDPEPVAPDPRPAGTTTSAVPAARSAPAVSRH